MRYRRRPVDLNPLFLTVPVMAVVLFERWPYSPDLRPRLWFELGLLAMTGLVGCLIGGTAGVAIAAAGVLPLAALGIVRRRCLRLMTFAQADELTRAVRWLDALSWPVALQAFNLNARDEACVLAGEPAGLTAHISRFRRHTRAARLMLAVEAVDAEAVATMSREMLSRGNTVEDRVMAANLLAYHDLGAVIDWYRSAGSRRLHGRGHGALVELGILICAGRVEAVRRRVEAVGESEFDIARSISQAEVFAGVEPDEATALLDQFGAPGQAAMHRILRWSTSPQQLTGEQLAEVDRIARAFDDRLLW